jgi:hypothetical protein
MRKGTPRKSPSSDAPMAKITPYGLRLPPDLKERLDISARANGRSLNSEIIERLQRSFADDFGVPDFVTGDRLDVLEIEVTSLRQMVTALNKKIEG